MVVAGVVEVGEDGDTATDAVLFGVAVDDEVLATLPVDHHEGTVGFAEERVHGAGDAVLRERDNLLCIVESESAPHNLLLVELPEELELLKVFAVGLSFEEIFDLLVHLGAAFGGFEHLAHHRLATLPRLRHISLNVCLFVKIREKLLDERGHGGVVGGAGGVTSVGVSVRRLVENDFGTLRVGKCKTVLTNFLSQFL